MLTNSMGGVRTGVGTILSTCAPWAVPRMSGPNWKGTGGGSWDPSRCARDNYHTFRHCVIKGTLSIGQWMLRYRIRSCVYLMPSLTSLPYRMLTRMEVPLLSPDFNAPDYYTRIKKALTAGRCATGGGNRRRLDCCKARNRLLGKALV